MGADEAAGLVPGAGDAAGIILKKWDSITIPTHKVSQVERRGWNWENIGSTVAEPVATGSAVNRANGNSATAYFSSTNQYVIVDDVTGDLVQASDRFDDGWIPDGGIVMHDPR